MLLFILLYKIYKMKMMQNWHSVEPITESFLPLRGWYLHKELFKDINSFFRCWKMLMAQLIFYIPKNFWQIKQSELTALRFSNDTFATWPDHLLGVLLARITVWCFIDMIMKRNRPYRNCIVWAQCRLPRISKRI